MHCLFAPPDRQLYCHMCDIPLLLKARPDCARQSLASTVSARSVAAKMSVAQGLLTPCLNLPDFCSLWGFITCVCEKQQPPSRKSAGLSVLERRSKTRVSGRRVSNHNGKPQVFPCIWEAFLEARACVQVPCAQNMTTLSMPLALSHGCFAAKLRHPLPRFFSPLLLLLFSFLLMRCYMLTECVPHGSSRTSWSLRVSNWSRMPRDYCMEASDHQALCLQRFVWGHRIAGHLCPVWLTSTGAHRPACGLCSSGISSLQYYCRLSMASTAAVAAPVTLELPRLFLDEFGARLTLSSVETLDWCLTPWAWSLLTLAHSSQNREHLCRVVSHWHQWYLRLQPLQVADDFSLCISSSSIFNATSACVLVSSTASVARRFDASEACVWACKTAEVVYIGKFSALRSAEYCLNIIPVNPSPLACDVTSVEGMSTAHGALAQWPRPCYTICACRALMVGKPSFLATENFEGLWWAFAGGAWKLSCQLSKVWCSHWEGLTIKVHLRLQQSFSTSGAQGSALRVAHDVARGVFWGSFFRVPGMHCFPVFPLKGGIKGDIKGDIKGGQQGQTSRAANGAECTSPGQCHLQNCHKSTEKAKIPLGNKNMCNPTLRGNKAWWTFFAKYGRRVLCRGHRGETLNPSTPTKPKPFVRSLVWAGIHASLSLLALFISSLSLSPFLSISLIFVHLSPLFLSEIIASVRVCIYM